jgi:phosphate transport system permease protein
MDILVGVPSVIFGLWGALTFGPLLADTAYPLINGSLGYFIPFFSGDYELGRSIMTASVVLAIMIFPIVMALSYEAISSVPTEVKDSSLSLGATKWQTIRRVVLKDARSGILGAIILGVGRALGETMAVLMIMNYSPSVPSSIFSNGATMTSAIAVNFSSAFANDQARHGLFSIALLLFMMVLVLNYALIAVTKNSFGTKMQRGLNGVMISYTNFRNKVTRPLRRSKERSVDLDVRLDPRTMFSSTLTLRRYDGLMAALIYLVAILIIVIVGYILGDIIIRGGLAFQVNYLTETQLSGGGFLNAITGSMMLIGIAIVVALPLTLLAAIYVSEYSVPTGRLFRISYVAVSTLSSTPSIIFGAFGFMLFVLYLGFGFSLLAGGLTLAFMAVPIFYVSNFEAIRSVPHTYREASFALGISKWATIREMVLPSSVPAISSGIMIGIGRIIGETAAVLITAGFATFLTTSVAEPSASLPVMIYHMYDVSAGNPVLMQKVYAAAFLLIVMVVVLNLIGKVLSYYYSRKVGTG